ncbi:MAG: hypothetical protein AAGF01_32895 [Cyanobacteria bacterium P01_G01_bin.38]
MFGLKTAAGWLATIVVSTGAIAGMAVEAQAQDRSLWLYDGDSDIVEGYFAAGEEIYGGCDEDCYDLDLFMYNEQGDVVAQDTAVDAAPVLVAPYEGSFMIEVSMPNCSHVEGCEVWLSSEYGF